MRGSEAALARVGVHYVQGGGGAISPRFGAYHGSSGLVEGLVPYVDLVRSGPRIPSWTGAFDAVSLPESHGPLGAPEARNVFSCHFFLYTQVLPLKRDAGPRFF